MSDTIDYTKQLGIVVSHTHWDREWRTPMWTSRYHLMHFMDSLIDLLEQDERFAHMVLDGQTVIIQDYLEIAPHQKTRLKRLIEEGKIAIGPWYTLPDNYPVGGESLIRNLTKGMAMSKELGYTPTIAYTTFGWGQSSQMPQIYHSFGLDFIITAKYISPKRVEDIEFLWRSPDGTQVLTSRLGEDARANFFFNAYIPIRHGIQYKSDAYRYRWGDSSVFRSAENARSDEDYHTLEGRGTYHREEVKDAIATAWEAFKATTVPSVRLLLNGSDATEAQQILPQILADAQSDDRQIVHGSLEMYASLLRERINIDNLKVVSGELRDGPAAAVTGNALATRVSTKQLNARVENQLTLIAEPLLAWAARIGSPVPHAESFRERSWEYLLKAHCHDSINGVGQDKVSQDTVYRLRQVEELATMLSDSAVGEILKRIDTTRFGRDKTLLFVYNPLPVARRSTLSISLDIPLSGHAWNISLVDSSGAVKPVQIESREERLVAIDDPDARPWTYDCQRIQALFTTGPLPPYGWEIFSVQIDESFQRNRIWPPARVVEESSIGYANCLENQFLKVVAQDNGTIRLEDKVRKKVYTDLLSLEDGGDLGDYWVYAPAYHGKTTLSTGAQVRVTQLSNGPEQGGLAIELELQVPSEAIIDQRGLTNEGKRSDHLTTLSICHTLSLRRDEPFLRLHTTIQNRAKDHRVRVRLPLGFIAKDSITMSHFHLERRPTEPSVIPGRSHGYWPEMETYPMRRFVDVVGENGGLAVCSESFFEYEVESDGNQSSLLLTAFRSVRNKICTEFRTYTTHTTQDGGQLLGTLEYEYALYPHGSDPEEVSAAEIAESFLLKPLVYQFSGSTEGTLRENHSMLSIDNPKVEISAIIPSAKGGGLVMRVWNTTDSMQSCTITTDQPIGSAAYVSLDGKQVLKTLSTNDNSVKIELEPCKIVTLKIGE